MTDLVQAQRKLQREADRLVQELQLPDLLRPFGEPVRVGSSAMGLMVRRDVDITVVCPRLDATVLAGISQLGATLMKQAEIVESVRLRNDTGQWNREPHAYPDGIYLGLSVRPEGGEPWTLDIWFVDEPDRQPDLAHLKALLPRVTDEHRLAILEIKHFLASGADDAPKVPSANVYEAVVDGDVRTLSDFKVWLRDRPS